MMKLVGMGIFARVAEAKSFSGAARRLGMSKSLVSKEVSKLEKALGARLLNRTTRQLSLTEFGAAFYAHCARVVQEAEEAELLVDRLHASPRGVLKCTAPVAFATLHIARALPEFLAQYPEVKVDLTVSDRFFELAEEGYDLAIRIARELPPNMVARPIAPINRVICGTPEYFASHGIPSTPHDLTDHDCIVYTHANPDSIWHLSANGTDIAVPIRGSLKVNDDEVAWQAVRAGLGLSLLPTFIVGDDLQSGRLQAVLSEYLPSEQNLYALYLPNRHLSAKVRVFIDFMLSKFAAPPYWDRNWLSASQARDTDSRPDEADAKEVPGTPSKPRRGVRTASRTESA
ncbi:MAG TPA: LysR family transcriptional regulator [Burkholderiales bacterium]|nr:LysR family transcriptional regulator [Burkholderiales bacterium]